MDPNPLYVIYTWKIKNWDKSLDEYTKEVEEVYWKTYLIG
jgi:hypothetical protein